MWEGEAPAEPQIGANVIVTFQLSRSVTYWIAEHEHS